MGLGTESLDALYWEQKWKDKQTKWDIGYASPPIVQFMQSYAQKGAAILIPGCGNAYEAAWLLDHGFSNITILDISATAIASARQLLKAADAVQFACADFFSFEGKFDLVLEQTFFCAIPIDKRSDYSRKMADLLDEKGQLVGVLFDREFEHAGPPFGGHAVSYTTLFADYFEFKHFEPCYNSIPARVGTELFINLLKK